jgi:hypothetical protein
MNSFDLLMAEHEARRLANNIQSFRFRQSLGYGDHSQAIKEHEEQLASLKRLMAS